jgi:uncharacterized protein DUF1097
MNQVNIAAFSAFSLTVIAVYMLGFYPFIPPWAIFIAWACFFHMDGGINRKQAYFSTITHIGLGAFAAWLSILAILNNPFDGALANQLWAPILIGAVIAVLSKMGVMARFCVTPAIIYGYASIFAYTSSPGRFSLETLLSLSFQNALVAILISIILGTSAGYANSMVVQWLSGLLKRTN